VADQNWIQIRKHGCHIKYNARAKFVNHDCDLALLEVQDPEFWQGLPSLELGDVPKMQDKIVVAGYARISVKRQARFKSDSSQAAATISVSLRVLYLESSLSR
jgi:hypothetical protein